MATIKSNVVIITVSPKIIINNGELPEVIDSYNGFEEILQIQN